MFVCLIILFVGLCFYGLFQCYPCLLSVVSGTMSEEAITDYFNLGVDLEKLYTLWSKVGFFKGR